MRLSNYFAFWAGALSTFSLASTSSHGPLHDSISDGQSLLGSLSTSDFTTFTHPLIPAKLRIKRHDGFCDPSVRSYSGYLDAAYGTQHMFFYLFESRGNPTDDPVLMWINGGPGCSSATGLFMELGPCRVNLDGNGTEFNPYSWNSNANVFFLDQPAGVGFSYVDHGMTVETTEDAAVTIQQFVSLFFETFSQYKGRPFHMSGESYAGRYIPLFASEILDYNAKAASKGLTPINLRSVAIGNGLSKATMQFPALYNIACTAVSGAPFMSIADCVTMNRGRPLCLRRVAEDCEESHDDIACGAAMAYCNSLIFGPIMALGKNPYDISKPCTGWPEADCYPIQGAIAKYLNIPDVRKALGVPDDFGAFEGCNTKVGIAFNERGDVIRTSEYHLAQLLERGVRVLLYDGTNDLVCNHVGYLKLAHALDWTGQADFNAATLCPWGPRAEDGLDGAQVAGETKTAQGLLTWATIDGAGHMVPYDKPVESLHMIQKWLNAEDL